MSQSLEFELFMKRQINIPILITIFVAALIITVLFISTLTAIHSNGQRIAILEQQVTELEARILDTVVLPPRIIADVSVDPRFWEDIQNQIDDLSDCVSQCETAKSFILSERILKSMDRSLSGKGEN